MQHVPTQYFLTEISQMLDADEIRWVKSTANELNNLLLVINESARFLESLCKSGPENQKYFDMLHDGVARATQATQAMRSRIREYEQGEPGKTIPHDYHAAPVPSYDVPPQIRETASPEKSNAAILKGFDITNPDGPKELILLVDDDESVIFITKRILADDGYRVVTAGSGRECLNIYKRLRERIALVLLDFEMPVMHGSEVFTQLRFMNPQVCVVTSSGFSEPEQMREMLAKGMKGFIPKPFTPEKLLLNIRLILDGLRKKDLPNY